MIEIKMCMEPVALSFGFISYMNENYFCFHLTILFPLCLVNHLKNWSIEALDPGILFFHCTTFVVIIWLS